MFLVAGMIPAPGEAPNDWWDNTGYRDAVREQAARDGGQTGPTKFVLCTEDRFFPPDFFRRLVAERLGIVPDEIASGHCVALSRPTEVAEILDGYAANPLASSAANPERRCRR
jgi:hypothetical protein